MRAYFTHCSAEKDPTLRASGQLVTPDKLYTNAHLQQFMLRCQETGVPWGVLSDLYGVYWSHHRYGWYEKHPDTVTPHEAEKIIQTFNHALKNYDEIWLYIRPESFHSFYDHVLNTTILTEKIKRFEKLEDIGST